MSITLLFKSMCYKKVLVFFVIITLVGSLSSCGFGWQKKETIPPQLRSLYLQSAHDYDQFTIGLKRTLVANGVNVFPNVNNADYVLDIVSMDFSHSGASVYSSAQASVYTFTFTANLSIYKVDGKVILPPQAISSSRVLTLNPSEVLAASNQVETVKQELQHEVIYQILNRLRSKQVAEALGNYKL